MCEEYASGVQRLSALTCMERQEDMGYSYNTIEPADLVYRGWLLYYPDNEATQAIVADMANRYEVKKAQRCKAFFYLDLTE